jgi:hypothetical protein
MTTLTRYRFVRGATAGAVSAENPMMELLADTTGRSANATHWLCRLRRPGLAPLSMYRAAALAKGKKRIGATPRGAPRARTSPGTRPCTRSVKGRLSTDVAPRAPSARTKETFSGCPPFAGVTPGFSPGAHRPANSDVGMDWPMDRGTKSRDDIRGFGEVTRLFAASRPCTRVVKVRVSTDRTPYPEPKAQASKGQVRSLPRTKIRGRVLPRTPWGRALDVRPRAPRAEENTSAQYPHAPPPRSASPAEPAQRARAGAASPSAVPCHRKRPRSRPRITATPFPGTQERKMRGSGSSVSVSAWSYPGASTVKVALKAGQTTALQISPRSASVGAGMLLGPLGGLPRAVGANLKQDGSTAASGGELDVQLVGGGR